MWRIIQQWEPNRFIINCNIDWSAKMCGDIAGRIRLFRELRLPTELMEDLHGRALQEAAEDVQLASVCHAKEDLLDSLCE